MGKRGPAPMPTSLRLLRGETRPSRVNYSEPTPSGGKRVPKSPSGLDEDARIVWDDLAPQLVLAGVLTEWDVNQFAVYCDATAQYWRASRIVADEGMLIIGDHGNRVKNPAMQLVRDCAQTIRAYAQEFGLTPSARSSIVIDKGEENGELERLLS